MSQEPFPFQTRNRWKHHGNKRNAQPRNTADSGHAEQSAGAAQDAVSSTGVMQAPRKSRARAADEWQDRIWQEHLERLKDDNYRALTATEKFRQLTIYAADAGIKNTLGKRLTADSIINLIKKRGSVATTEFSVDEDRRQAGPPPT